MPQSRYWAIEPMDTTIDREVEVADRKNESATCEKSSDVTRKKAEVITEDNDSVVHVHCSRMWCRREKENNNDECHPHDCCNSDWHALRKMEKTHYSIS
jgi:hypothetical protein